MDDDAGAKNPTFSTLSVFRRHLFTMNKLIFLPKLVAKTQLAILMVIWLEGCGFHSSQTRSNSPPDRALLVGAAFWKLMHPAFSITNEVKDERFWWSCSKQALYSAVQSGRSKENLNAEKKIMPNCRYQESGVMWHLSCGSCRQLKYPISVVDKWNAWGKVTRVWRTHAFYTPVDILFIPTAKPLQDALPTQFSMLHTQRAELILWNWLFRFPHEIIHKAVITCFWISKSRTFSTRGYSLMSINGLVRLTNSASYTWRLRFGMYPKKTIHRVMTLCMRSFNTE